MLSGQTSETLLKDGAACADHLTNATGSKKGGSGGGLLNGVHANRRPAGAWRGYWRQTLKVDGQGNPPLSRLSIRFEAGKQKKRKV